MAKKPTKGKEKTFSELANPFLVRCKISGLPGVSAMFCRRDDTEGTTTPNLTDEEERLRLLEAMLYKDGKGIYVPTDNIEQMLIGNQARMGAAKILGSYIEKNKGTEYTEFCDSCIWVHGPEDADKVYFKPRRTIWDGTDIRDRVRKTGKTVTRQKTERPLIHTPWSLEFFVYVTASQYTSAKIKMFFQTAGLRCGIGVYGPKFGRFLVTTWQKLSQAQMEKLVGKID